MLDITPDEARRIICTVDGKSYTKREIGRDEYTRWEIRLYTFLNGKINAGNVIAILAKHPDQPWTLRVAGTWVRREDRTDEYGWETTADTYGQMNTVLNMQGARSTTGRLICPVLPGDGWCDRFGPYRFDFGEE